MNDDATSKSQTIQRVEAVEVEVYNCPFCEQQFEQEEQMVEIGIDRREVANSKTRYQHQATLCVGCAESIFGYDRPSTSYNWTYVPETIGDLGWRGIGVILGGIALCIGMIAVLFAGIGLFAEGMADMFTSLLAVPSGGAEETAPSSGFEPIFQLVAVMIIVGAGVAIFREDQNDV